MSNRFAAESGVDSDLTATAFALLRFQEQLHNPTHGSKHGSSPIGVTAAARDFCTRNSLSVSAMEDLAVTQGELLQSLVDIGECV